MNEASRPKKENEITESVQESDLELVLISYHNDEKVKKKYNTGYSAGRFEMYDKFTSHLSDKDVINREALSYESLEKVCQKILADAVVNNELTSDGFAQAIIKYIEENKL